MLKLFLVDLDVSGGSTTIFHTPNGTMINKSHPQRPQAYQNAPTDDNFEQIYAEVYQPPSTSTPHGPSKPPVTPPVSPPVPPPVPPSVHTRRRSTSLPRPVTSSCPSVPRPDYEETPVFYTPRETRQSSHDQLGYPLVKYFKIFT